MFHLSLKLPAEYSDLDVALLGGVFIDLAASQSSMREENHETSPWGLEWLFEHKPDMKLLEPVFKIGAEVQNLEIPEDLDWQIKEIEDRDWLSYSYKQFPAFEVSPFFIYGSHHDGDVPKDLIGLQIDAATAFGSGEHGTTAECLQAMVDIQDQGACPWNILDMGTGSGILAIAAYKLWKSPVFAVDNDPESINVTRRHMQANDTPESATDIAVLVNEGFAGDEVFNKGPYELVIANILPAPLKAMAADIARAADANAYIILSGILNEQAEDVITHFTATGLRLENEIKRDGWSTLVMRK